MKQFDRYEYHPAPENFFDKKFSKVVFEKGDIS